MMSSTCRLEVKEFLCTYGLSDNVMVYIWYNSISVFQIPPREDNLYNGKTGFYLWPVTLQFYATQYYLADKICCSSSKCRQRQLNIS